MLNIPLIESPFFTEAFPPDDTDPQLLQIAESLHEDGYAIIDFPDDDFDARVEAIRRNLQDRYDWDVWRSGQSQGLRIQDAWTFDENVKRIAVNARVIHLLSQLYGKPAFPFQTLNFPSLRSDRRRGRRAQDGIGADTPFEGPIFLRRGDAAQWGTSCARRAQGARGPRRRQAAELHPRPPISRHPGG